MQRFFEESFHPETNRSAAPPLVTDELMGRMMAAAARNGLEFVRPACSGSAIPGAVSGGRRSQWS